LTCIQRRFLNRLFKYDGTLVIVSHDREFLDGLIGKVYEFRDRKIKENIGGIYDFLKKKKLESLQSLEKGLKAPADTTKERKTIRSKISWEEKKEREKEIRKLESKVVSSRKGYQQAGKGDRRDEPGSLKCPIRNPYETGSGFL
jgi:ATP-binding cassette, subfamily F, member 3